MAVVVRFFCREKKLLSLRLRLVEADIYPSWCRRRRSRSPLPRRPWNSARASDCSLIGCTTNAVCDASRASGEEKRSEVVTLLIITY